MTIKQAEKEANKQALLFEEKCKLGYTPDNRQTFSEYADYVLSIKEQAGTKHSTIKRYRELLERINTRIGYIRLTDIRPQHLSELYSKLRQSGERKRVKATLIVNLKRLVQSSGITLKQLSKLSNVSLTTINAANRGETITSEKAENICKILQIPINKVFRIEQDNRPLSEKTIQEHHRLISLILSYAEMEMLVPYNAASKVINKPKSDTVHEVNYFEPEELEKILAYFK